MKKIFSLIFILSSFSAFAQINVGSKLKIVIDPGRLDEEQILDLKQTTTLFVYRESDKDQLEAIKSALNEVWTISKLKFISYDEFKSGNWTGNYSYFTIGGYTKTETGQSIVSIWTYIYLMLWKYDDDGDREYFARIELYPTFATYKKAEETEESDEMVDYLYQESVFRNWFPGYLKNSVKFVNDKLQQGEEHWYHQSGRFGDMKPLVKDTLYVPDYVLVKFNKFNGDESERHSQDELFEKYDYTIAVIPAEKLSDMILHRKTDFYYLSYIKSSTTKYVNVFNGRTGEMLYAKEITNVYNIKPGDLKKVSRAVAR